MTLIEKSLEIAASQLGVQEIPKNSNAGADVEKYLKSVKLGKGYSWCMAFVYWCVNEAAKSLNVTNPLVCTAGVLNEWNKVAVDHKFTKNPQAGDIFIMDFGKGAGHTGFVTSVGNGRIQTIEGNSNDDGSREGYEVCRKPNGRPLSSIKGYIRLVVK